MDIGRAVIIPAVDSEDGGGVVEGGRRSRGGRESVLGVAGGGGGGGMRGSGRGGGGGGSGGGGGGSQGPGVSVSATVDRNRASGVNSAVSIMGWNGFSEMAWKRRHANDPAMMRELRRYQKLMLLTLLPAITGSGAGRWGPAARTSNRTSTRRPTPRTTRTPTQTLLRRRTPLGEATSSPTDSTKEPDEDDDDDDNAATAFLNRAHGRHRRRSPAEDISPLAEKRTGAPWARGGSHPSSSSSNEGTHLPLTVYNPLNMSPKRRGRRKSRDDNPRRKSHRGRDAELDYRRDVVEVGSYGDSPGDGSSANDSAGGGSGGGGDFDLLTLAALYLESRQRIFGKEWHYRPESQVNTRPTGQVGSTGISRPRRLTPLSPNTRAPIAKDNNPRSYSGVIPAPAGLHLSVNYTHNLDLDESSYIAERARAMKPRLRRLNSLDDVMATTSPLGSPQHSIYRATSAPDLSQSAQARHFHSLLRSDSKASLDSISPPPVTPARANTPTGARHSAVLAKPQIVGGSLATNSAVKRTSSRSLSSSRGANFKGSKEPKKTRAMSEGSRNALLQPPPWGALPPDYRDLDIPTAPPPSAIGDTHRKNGKIHLEPLAVRKTTC
ncbi:LOW QUALITY PROTEIN: uncharacterized protein LOC135214268 [Macrobrachium nipponense]|uniref:LOW QUALITY PROTEIN: uncharacterized protein LOC135214268 n=1 Tax=Macrobrachium nipponense TaxID=159736 RepID=UPI0030C7F254